MTETIVLTAVATLAVGGTFAVFMLTDALRQRPTPQEISEAFTRVLSAATVSAEALMRMGTTIIDAQKALNRIGLALQTSTLHIETPDTRQND